MSQSQFAPLFKLLDSYISESGLVYVASIKNLEEVCQVLDIPSKNKTKSELKSYIEAEIIKRCEPKKLNKDHKVILDKIEVRF